MPKDKQNMSNRYANYVYKMHSSLKKMHLHYMLLLGTQKIKFGAGCVQKYKL